jgi:hypothetical protein
LRGYITEFDQIDGTFSFASHIDSTLDQTIERVERPPLREANVEFLELWVLMGPLGFMLFTVLYYKLS